MTDKTDSGDYSLAKMCRLSDVDTDILELCQRIMTSRREVAWIGARQETSDGEDLRKLVDRRVELYDQIDADMGSLEGYRPESLYIARRILDVVLDVLAQQLINNEDWLAKGPIERLVVVVSEVIRWAAEDETRRKWQGVCVVPDQGKVA